MKKEENKAKNADNKKACIEKRQMKTESKTEKKAENETENKTESKTEREAENETENKTERKKETKTENKKESRKETKSKTDKKKIKFSKWMLLEAAVVFAVIFLLTVTNLFGAWNYLLTDTFYQWPGSISSRIKIIAIDEKTLERYGRIDTWSRQIYADLLEAVNAEETARPAVVAFDVTFSGNVDEGDTAFAENAAKYGNVITNSVFVYDTKGVKNEDGLLVYPVSSIVEPYAQLKDATAQGYANIALDSDGTVRRIALSQSYEGIEYPAFSKVIYDRYCQSQGLNPQEAVKDKYGRSLINYAGRPGSFEAISLCDVIDGKIDARAFKDSILLVGAYAAGMQDNYRVPNGGSKEMYGVEIHANILQCLLQNHFSITANPVLCGVCLGLLGALLHILFRLSYVYVGIGILLCAIPGEIGVGRLLNEHGYAMSLLYFPLGVMLSYGYNLIVGYVIETIKRKKVLQAFKKYVAPEIVEEISRRGEFNIKLGGENRDVAVLFVDIRGFTTMSEALMPEQVVEILNRYLNLTTQSIFKNRGTLDKFVGDATMAVFNAPFDLDDYEYRAVCAAMDIVAGAQAIEKEFMEKFGKQVGFGVGVNVGPAVVGNIGCEFRMDYTAIGDTVNTAARLEANAARGQILISEQLYERLKDRIKVEPVGEIPLKGKANGIFVYSVVGKINESI